MESALVVFALLVAWALLVVWLFRRVARRFQHERAMRSEHSQAIPPSVMPPPPHGEDGGNHAR